MSDIVITSLGATKLTAASITEPLVLTEFAVGDANNSTVSLDPSTTALVNEKFRTVINSSYNQENSLVVECVLRADAEISEGFNLNELGVFDEDGDLIFYVKLGGSYRPEKGSTTTVEQIFNINTSLNSTENVTVNINEVTVATQDALERLEERLALLETKQQEYVNSSIGIDKWFNTNNTYKDQNIVKIGSKTWALMDESNVLSISDYPLLFTNTNALEILDSEGQATGTFILPQMFLDGTIRHLAKGETRLLGSYELDALQEHRHNITYLNLPGGLSFSATSSTRANQYNGTGKVMETDSDGNDVRVANETRMKNTAGQWYVLAKID